jgi:uncharacterized protein YlxW (UPF0749 family)
MSQGTDEDTDRGTNRGTNRNGSQERHDLLGYLSTHAYDEDYAWVAHRRAVAGEPVKVDKRGRRPIGVAGAITIALFVVLIVVAAAQTSRNAPTAARQRRELVGQVDAARVELSRTRGRIRDLQRETARLERKQLASDSSAKGLLARIRGLGAEAGTVAVTGPGVRVVADDAPHATSARNKVLDSDLQRLANGLWEAGAEAIAINGQRLTNLSAIRLAGSAITVNNRSLRRPYVVTAIGDPDTLPARFAETTSGQAWLDLQREVGLQLSIRTADSLRLPAADVGDLRYARRQPRGAS